MRILIAHSAYRSGPSSGENQVAEAESALLEEHGHEVWRFIPQIDDAHPVQLAANAVWSRGAARRIADMVRKNDIEVAHFHNLFPLLSPLAVHAAARSGATCVMTLHNYRLTCLSGTLFRDGRVCEDCVATHRIRGVAAGCYRGSRPASIALATSLSFHERFGSFDRVSRFFAVSEFVRDLHVRAGLSGDRVIVKPNFVPARRRRSGSGREFVYAGRLAKEKGVDTVVRAWRPELGTLRVVGDGPERPNIERIAGQGVEFVGAVSPADVASILAGARAVLVPSVWYEAAPLIILEAYAAGVPVVASDLGAMRSLVTPNLTGLLVPAGNTDAWQRAIATLADDATVNRLGDGAYRRWLDRHSPRVAVRALESAYVEAVDQTA
jgi:glycosyltransferase involved in cell wall biosynthesis